MSSNSGYCVDQNLGIAISNLAINHGRLDDSVINTSTFDRCPFSKGIPVSLDRYWCNFLYDHWLLISSAITPIASPSHGIILS